MQIRISLTAAVIALTTFGAWAQTNLNGTRLNILSIDLSGASSLHRLTLAVNSNNVISATGTRLDTAPGEVSFDPAQGAPVTSMEGSSLGNAFSTTNITTTNKTLRDWRNRTNVVVTLSNTIITTVTPFGIFLDDASQIKGAVTSIACTRQEAKLSSSGSPIITTRSTGGKVSSLDGAIANGEKTGNFSDGEDD